MFIGAVTSRIEFTPFGTASVEERIVALSGGHRRIVYYYDEPDTSTFRYRVLNMIQALQAFPEGGVSASWFCKADVNDMERFVDRADALVICRAHYTTAINRMVARAHSRRIQVFFDCDDLVFDPQYVPIVLKSLDLELVDEANLNFWYARFSRHGAAMRLCDRGITTNLFLAKRMAESAGFQVAVIPNFLNRVQQSLSSELYQSKRDSRFASDGKITIGYFSGSPSHNRDFAVAAPALAQLMDEDPRIVLRVVGFLDLKDQFLRHGPRVEFKPLQDPFNLQRLIGEVEVNIAPLQQNVFTNCKSELKFFEAGITGTVTVATASHMFSNVICDGENGFLAETHQWKDKLHAACALVDNTSQYAAMADRAFDVSKERYGWDQYGALISEVVFGAAHEKQTAHSETSTWTEAPTSNL